MTERSNPAAGILRAAIGRPDALDCFAATVPAFLNSLAPLLAFPIAGAVIELFNDGPLIALLIVLLSVILQLTPPVVSHWLARRWDREPNWLRYATAYNWCQWALPVVGSLLVVLFGTAVGVGLPEMLAAQGVLLGVFLYDLWLNYFLARHGLGLPRGKAALLVLAVTLGRIVLGVLPSFLA